jgi:hypothetical protein
VVVVLDAPPGREPVPKPFGSSEAHAANAAFSLGVVVVVTDVLPVAAPLGRVVESVTPWIFRQLR